MATPDGGLKDIDLKDGGGGGGETGSWGVKGREIETVGAGGGGTRPVAATASSEQGLSEADPEEGFESGGSSDGRRRPPDGMVGHAMEGVGEDEKAYNYICSLDKVNLGGPGWFNDVFKVNVEVDADRTWMDTLSLSVVPRGMFQRHCSRLDASKRITGTVTVVAPTSKRVWLSGVTVTFEEHLVTVDTEVGERVGALEAQVALGQFISGKAVFDFSLDLELLNGHRRWPVRETYVGELMALRHRLQVVVQRPWYTFNVNNQVPISMECLSEAPGEDAGQDNEDGGPNHVLVISDCNGRCEFDFRMDSFNLGDTLAGSVLFSGIASPIVAAHVMLLKAEFMYGEASEILVAEHTILGPKRVNRKVPPSSGAGIAEYEHLRRQYLSPFVDRKAVHFVHTQELECRMEQVLGEAEISVELHLGSLPLTPSYMSLTQDIASVNNEAELVGVRYYIRLILEDSSQAAYWHTHEIFFHRSEPTPSSQGFDDASSHGSSSSSGSGSGSSAESNHGKGHSRDLTPERAAERSDTPGDTSNESDLVATPDASEAPPSMEVANQV